MEEVKRVITALKVSYIYHNDRKDQQITQNSSQQFIKGIEENNQNFSFLC